MYKASVAFVVVEQEHFFHLLLSCSGLGGSDNSEMGSILFLQLDFPQLRFIVLIHPTDSSDGKIRIVTFADQEAVAPR